MAAHLANGVPFEKVGPTVPIDDLVRLRDIRPSVADGVLDTSIIHILIYGNVTLRGDRRRTSRRRSVRWSRVVSSVIDFPAFDGAGPIQERTVWERTFGRVPLGSSLLDVGFGGAALARGQPG